MRTISLAAVFSLALAIPLAAQGTAAPIKVDQQFVLEQFGDQFTLVTSVPVSVGDLDGDGVEDIVIPARCKNPMIDQASHNFRVVDPLYDFFGYGDPRITTTFSEGNPALRGLVALVINGAGTDAWRSATPKSKFVIVNLPFKALSVRKMQLNKKRMIEAIYVEEAGDMGESSAVFFDGKKFRYVPMGGDMQ